MKRSSGILVTGISATLLSTGAVMGSGFLWPDDASSQTVAEAQQGATADTSTGTADAGSTSDSSTATDSGTTDSGSSDTGSTDTSTADPSATTDTATGDSGTAVYDGEAVTSRYGVFQAEITVEDGQVTAIDWLQSGEADHHSQEINDYAMPVLEEAILEAQDVNVGYVSGASYTSEAVEDAVYSAMQAAGLA
ncbi:FMN-binding protein [Demequina sp. SYSU T00192]|uniref:FMN-binding protein n=1 Tax=Demequina litoralis TaxID=3051660 RepID=A0ABT8G9A3_9MICO|nr:FMN-binding protein [Demequina sp. SYSU T00192]MDN4475723.1 FMN-binding protein [Demequina sp. SYSU T00192]